MILLGLELSIWEVEHVLLSEQSCWDPGLEDLEQMEKYFKKYIKIHTHLHT